MRRIILLVICVLGIMSAAGEQPVVRAALFPLREAVISARIDSVVMPDLLKVGSIFQKGDTLLLLDSSRYIIEMKRCREFADYAKIILTDKKELWSKKLTSDFELKKAEHDYNMAVFSLEDAKLNLSFCYILAPFNGKIAEIITHEYETVRPGQPLLRIIDDSRLLAVINPPLTWGEKIETGEKVSLKLSNGKIVSGTVHEKAPVADNRTETIRIRICIDNRTGELCAGMTGELIYGE